MKRMLYGVARRSMSQEMRSRLDRWLARQRRSASPIIKALHGTFDASELLEELSRRVPPDFDVLMVHCAFDDLVPMYREGPLELLRALKRLCGVNRTLVMPAFSYVLPDSVGHLETSPRFDVRLAPSRMGLLSEMFRRTPGVVRSLHPTHSVCALGPLAAQLTSEHHLGAATFGAKSPFAKMAEVDTVIVGLGKPFYRVLTQVHVPEDLLGDRFPVARDFRVVDMTLVDGETEHRYSCRVDVTKTDRRLDRLPQLLHEGDLVDWRYHGVDLFWAHAGRLTTALCEAALKGRTVYADKTLA
jgi:aminoglycoside 3-N-acetyltransferase